MAYREEMQIDGKTVVFSASIFTSVKYRVIYGRSLEHDLDDLEIAVATNSRELSGIAPALLRRFGNIAHLMASEADPRIARDPDDWFSQFKEFSVYDVAPRLAHIWRSRRGTPSGKNSHEGQMLFLATPRERARRAILQRIAERNRRGLEIESVTINDDLGVEEAGKYIALVYLIWTVNRDRQTLRGLIAAYSADLAAALTAQCPEVEELVIFWRVPKLGKSRIKHNFERSGDKLVAVR